MAFRSAMIVFKGSRMQASGYFCAAEPAVFGLEVLLCDGLDLAPFLTPQETAEAETQAVNVLLAEDHRRRITCRLY